VTPDPPVSPVPAVIRDAAAAGRPWGFWATLGFFAIIMVVQLGVGVPVALVFAVAIHATQPEAVAHVMMQKLATNGLCLSLIAIVSTPPCIGLTLLFAWVRRQIPVGRYLGLGMPSAWRTAGWVGATVLFAGAAAAFALVMPDPIGSSFMMAVYQTSVFPPLMVVAFVIAAPLAEEFVFRGFLFEGIRHSRLGVAGAFLISSALWAGSHIQYGWVSIGVLFFFGLLLAAARLRTESVWVCVLMHAAFNLLGVVEVMVAAHA